MTKTVFATNTSVALNPSPNAFSLVRNPGINNATAYCDVRKHQKTAKDDEQSAVDFQIA